MWSTKKSKFMHWSDFVPNFMFLAWFAQLFQYLNEICLRSIRYEFHDGVKPNRLGFYPTTFLQPVNGSKNSILNWVLKLNLFKFFQVFFYLSRKTIDRFFILLQYCFYSYKHRILKKQKGLTNRFVILRKNMQLRSKNQK